MDEMEKIKSSVGWLRLRNDQLEAENVRLRDKLTTLQTAVEKEMGADCMRNGEHRKVRNSILGAVDDSREGE